MITPEKPAFKKKAKSPKKGPKKFGRARSIAKLVSAVLAAGFIVGFFLMIIYGHDLPDIDKLYNDDLKHSIVILD